MNGNFEIKDGEYTSTIYTLIKEQRYIEAINILNYIYDTNPTSRAALSLLAYCYFYMQVLLILLHLLLLLFLLLLIFFILLISGLCQCG